MSLLAGYLCADRLYAVPRYDNAQCSDCGRQRNYQCIQIYDYDFAPCIFSPVFHENTPVSSAIAETRAFWKFIDTLTDYEKVRKTSNSYPWLYTGTVGYELRRMVPCQIVA